ncbi:hypothetical protein [Shimia ponticola]|uniref:hypothetical protein n=1 Tax=Shimia ponticola TaxID=2582893 RepID=UPI0011BEAAD6|nr:hypothetical protein [Shimia ponticola]
MGRTADQQSAVNAMNAADEEIKRAYEMENAATTADARRQAAQMRQEAEQRKRDAVRAAQEATKRANS